VELIKRRAALLAALLGRAVLAAALGTVCGTIGFGAADRLFGWSAPDNDTATGAWLLFLMLGAFPIALGALLLIGSLLTLLLRGLAGSRWSLAAGALAGAGTGWGAMVLLDFGALDPFQTIGALIGGFTGLFWAAYARGPIVRMQETGFDDTP
jgi:hypothetical protein